jgi:hypothetical protein
MATSGIKGGEEEDGGGGVWSGKLVEAMLGVGAWRATRGAMYHWSMWRWSDPKVKSFG